MPLFDALLRGRLSWATAALGEGRSGVFKRKRAGSVVRIGEELFFWVGAWGFQGVSQAIGQAKSRPFPGTGRLV